MNIEIIDPEPTHGRPRIASFSDKEGEFNIHFERVSGALWIFALGPSSGERAQLALPVDYAQRVLEWIDGGMEKAFYGRNATSIRCQPFADGTRVSIGRGIGSRQWLALRFNPSDFDRFRELIAVWAARAAMSAP